MIRAIGQLARYRRRRESRRVLRGLPSRYRVESQLGQGGMAVVYLARDRQLDRQVAVKVVHPGLAFERDAVARLANEARLLAQLEHPNIVTIHDIEPLENGGVALVMQYVRGDTLRGVLDRTGPLPIVLVERVLKEIADALAAAHRRGIVHRDVKPENIYIEQESGRALLADFGIARGARIDLGPVPAGEALGTPYYMSPEQIAEGHVDGRSDLYSLGLIGYEMLTGERPWGGEPIHGVLDKQQHEYLPSLPQRRPDVPAHLERALGKALRKNPLLRPASADEFLSLLQQRGKSPISRYERGAEHRRAPLPSEFSPEAPTVRLDRSQGRAPPTADPADPGPYRPTGPPWPVPGRSQQPQRSFPSPPAAGNREWSSYSSTNSSTPPERATLPRSTSLPPADEHSPTVAIRRGLRSPSTIVSSEGGGWLGSILGILAGAAGVAALVVGIGLIVLSPNTPAADAVGAVTSAAEEAASDLLAGDGLPPGDSLPPSVSSGNPSSPASPDAADR